jgi:hypothetical protein
VLLIPVPSGCAFPVIVDMTQLCQADAKGTRSGRALSTDLLSHRGAGPSPASARQGSS